MAIKKKYPKSQTVITQSDKMVYQFPNSDDNISTMMTSSSSTSESGYRRKHTNVYLRRQLTHF